MSHETDANSGGAELPDVAFAVALAGFRDMTPARLRVLLDGRPARVVYSELRSGEPGLVETLARLGGSARSRSSDEALDMEISWGASGSIGAMERARSQAREALRSWRAEASRTPVGRRWEELQARGIGVVRRGESAYPRRLLRARQVPELLYVCGRLDHVTAPCVGIVGTRRATHYGLEVAGELGRELAEHGVVVVSGLARGIDAAAHRGVLAAGRRLSEPLAVVGGGVDVVYPRENRRLWDEVLATGGIISEAPPGAPPESWRFPLRNRIIAALSQVLVVVESSRQGGAIHTVLAADAYGVPILAVPGSVRSPQSEGTNAIIQEGGAGVVLDVHDVLAVLALACQEDGTPISFAAARSGHDPRRRVSTSWKLAWGRPPGGEPSQPPPRPSSRPASDDRSNRDGRNNQEAMDFERPIPTPASPMSRREEARRRAVTGCSPTEQAVLEAVDYTATLIDLVCRRTKLDLGVVALAIDRLEEVGLVRTDGAAWIRA